MVLCICYRVCKDGDSLSGCTVRECLWALRTMSLLSAAELAEKIAEYVQDLPPLKQNETEIKLPVHIE